MLYLQDLRDMQFIAQRNGVDCGIAVSAMLANCTYDDACDADPHPTQTTGYTVAEMVWALESLTGQPWRASRAQYAKPVAHLRMFMREPHPVLIRASHSPTGHWVAWDGRRVYDPEMPSPLLLGAYARREWQVIRVLLLDV